MAASSALVLAHTLAVEAEDLHDEGRWKEAAQKLEGAAEQYVRATLSTTDVQSLQSLRLLALSHSQRSHELRCRIALRNAHEEAAPTPAPAPAPARAGEWTSSDSAADASSGSRAGDRGIPLCGCGSGGATAALSRLGSHLLSTLEALHFGAEELACAELLLPPQLAASSRISLGGGLLSDSYCVVPALASSSGGRSAELLTPGTPAVSPGTARGADGGGNAAVRAQLSALHSEKASLKQRCAEMQAALAKVQRRGAEQLRLARKALAIVREVHGAGGGPGAPDCGGAELEARSLRGQLEAALAAQRAQAETVRKYERRWQELKASARRKQQLKDEQAASLAAESPPRHPVPAAPRAPPHAGRFGPCRAGGETAAALGGGAHAPSGTGGVSAVMLQPGLAPPRGDGWGEASVH